MFFRLEADGPARLLSARDHGGEVVEEGLYLLVVVAHATFQLLQLLEDALMRDECIAHAHEELNDADAHGGGAPAAKHDGEHEDAMLREGVWQSTADMAVGGYRRMRYHLTQLAGCQLEHEQWRETIGVALHLLTQADRLNPVEFGQVAVEHHLTATDHMDAARDGLVGRSAKPIAGLRFHCQGIRQ